MKQKLKIILNFSLFGLFVANFANAALVRCGTSADPKPCGIGDLVGGIFLIVNFLLGSATLVAIGYILFGGVRMIVAAGNENQIKDAKSTITNAIVGLVIIILAFLIVTSVTSYLTGQSLTQLRTNFLKF